MFFANFRFDEPDAEPNHTFAVGGAVEVCEGEPHLRKITVVPKHEDLKSPLE